METPRHLWIVGGASLLWNAAAATEHVLTQTETVAYQAIKTPEQIAFFENAPPWFEAAWAVGIFTGLFGAFLLLLRLEASVRLLTFSMLALFFSAIYSVGIARPSIFELMSIEQTVFATAVYLMSVIIWMYARAMARRAVLR